MSNGNDHYDVWSERIKLVLPSIDKVIQYVMTLAILFLQIRNGGKLDNVDVKADAAAVKAATAAEIASQNKTVDLKTNKALNEWKASYTKSPEDAAAAHEATDLLEKHEAKIGQK